jgi:hypothetical protein
MLIKPPEICDPLIDQIFHYIELEAAKEKPRQYVGASSIGHECELYLWLKYRHPEKAAPRKAKLILAANDGHRSEDLAATYIRNANPDIKLWTYKDDGTQYGFSALNGEFKGHVDGIIEGIPLAPKTPHIWENKSCNQKKFDDLKNKIEKCGSKGALEQWNYQYYCQAIINMDYFDLTRHYMTVWLAGNRDLITLRTEANPLLATSLTRKAERIITATTPPIGISSNPSFYKCKKDFCEFSENCPSIHPEKRELYYRS